MKITDILEYNTEPIQVGDFVFLEHPFAWGRGKDYGVLSPWEITNQGIITGQVIGTYGPWDHVPNSKLHWDIVPDTWIAGRFHAMKVLGIYSKEKEFNYNNHFTGFDPEEYKKYINSILPDIYSGSCQIEPIRVCKDIRRTRNWKHMIVTNDFSDLEKCLPIEMIIEKEIVKGNIEKQNGSNSLR